MGLLRGGHPEMTAGTFHDALRRLDRDGRIKLGGWPKSINDLPEPELALFVRHKVVYYATPSADAHPPATAVAAADGFPPPRVEPVRHHGGGRGHGGGGGADGCP